MIVITIDTEGDVFNPHPEMEVKFILESLVYKMTLKGTPLPIILRDSRGNRVGIATSDKLKTALERLHAKVLAKEEENSP